MIEFLKGKKTYFTAAIAVALGVGLIRLGHPIDGVELILAALGLGALRAGVAKCEPPADPPDPADPSDQSDPSDY
jgi:hypothetical protein